MKPLGKITVNAKSKRYAAYCGEGALGQLCAKIAGIGPTSGVYLLSSTKAWKKQGRHLQSALGALNKSKPILLDDRETAKNLGTVEKVCRALVRAGADRHATIVAVGGGVVGDVAGFAAASYLRGVRLVHVPTTLVAQVDSAIGGKTGVNLPEGKNLVGAFYQPDLVVVDPTTLRTLPDREFRSGIYEVIKYGIIGDAKLFGDLESRLDMLLRRDHSTISAIVERCIAQKARVTSLDEREAGLRETLNFGHTFGHALESVTRYRVFRHGEAVGWGMIAAALLGVALTGLRFEEAARIIRLVRRVGPLPHLPKVSRARVLAAMRSDKKSREGRLRFVLPLGIGRVRTGVEVPDELVNMVWSELVRLKSNSR